MNQITQSITRLYNRHRIVFWYDEKAELRAEFDALALPGVEKIVLGNNQFAVKQRILRQEPEQKFLLYQPSPRPADLDNWLLDVELAHATFAADQTALWLSELGLGLEFVEVVRPHAAFLGAEGRRAALKRLAAPDDTPRQLRLKMLAVCAGAEPRLDEILEALLAELAEERDEKMRTIQRSGLDGLLWQEVARIFGYAAETPGRKDFALALFQSGYALGLGDQAALHSEALLFLRRWQNNRRSSSAFDILSARYAEILDIEADLPRRKLEVLVDLDLFALIDLRLLSELVQVVAARTLSAAQCEEYIRRRRQSHWYEQHAPLYEAVAAASQFLHTLDSADLTVRSLAQGVEQYSRVWFRLDQLYRHFVHAARRGAQPTLLAPLAEKVENFYTNNYLLKVNDLWQPLVDAAARWEAAPHLSQADFYEEQVRKPFLTKGLKVFVIISDALRYEVGEELLRRIRQEDRYDAEILPALTLLPSYTQLGMAALLPHTSLAIDPSTSAVLVDGNSSQGTENRRKILDRALPGRSTALNAKEVMEMNRDESRALFRDHEVVYVYHNHIDAVGDKRDSEERVFAAVEEALEELITLVKKLTNANATNLLITADHGFVYQNRLLEESDFASAEPAGAEILHYDRRFVLGKGLHPSPSFKKFRAADVGLDGELEMLLPKSINRLRQKGSGSRYVHGGASLQEVVIPVLQINKKRQSDLSQVEVEILRGTTSTITAGQLAVAFYQSEPVSEKVQARTLRAGLYSQAGVLLSDQHEIPFDLTSEHPRQREVQRQFILNREAEKANNQEVVLRLEEQVEGTSHYRVYRSARYTLRRSFTSDFDF
jgi:uncharacterized protein (TIGR02687 family)